ncbi:MAG: class I SAM-dependent methyltransferase [Candidatus Aenigmatarchaeota archaeon]
MAFDIGKYEGKVSPKRLLYLGKPKIVEHFLYSELLKNKDARILDCGCGAGDDTRYLVGNGLKNTIGIDHNRMNMELGFDYYGDKEKLSGNFIIGDACAMPFNSGHFDYVYSNSLIHYLSNRENVHKFLDEAHRVLKSGGINFGSTPGRLDRIITIKDECDGHNILFLTEESFKTDMEEVGFRNVYITGSDFTDPLTNEKLYMFQFISMK